MTRPRNDIPPAPKLYPDGRGGQRWMTYWTDDKGKPRTKAFGNGDVSKAQAQRRYQHWLDTQWKVKAHVRTPKGEEAAYTITRLAASYLLWARATYRKRGRPTSHVWNIRYAMRAIRDMYGDELANDFDAPKLASLRDGMKTKATGGMRAGSTVNDRLSIIQHAFGWARERGKVSATVANDVKNVSRATRGVKPRRKILSIARDTLDATAAKLPPMLVDMVELLWLTGARPGEICDIAGQHVETNGDVWLYRPPLAKMEHKAIERIVCLGPRAQRIVKKYLTPNLSAPLFSPAVAHRQRLETRRKELEAKGRKFYRPRVADPVAGIGDRYTSETFRRAIHYACKLAGVAKWHPNQVRHSAASITRKRFGKDAARALLGHGAESTTDIYLDPDVQTAMRIAREVG